MSNLIDDALARYFEAPRRIDYERMKRVHPKQKAALTRAVKSGDAETIARTIKAATTEWDAIGAWPDDWHRWQVALDDALHYSQHIDIRDL